MHTNENDKTEVQCADNNSIPSIKDNLDAMIEQYKLAVQMADNVSQRRGTANSFYISMLTLLIAVITTFFSDNELFMGILSILGVVVSLSWMVLIKSYKKLNTAKFNVINQMENNLPFAPFRDEWKYLEDYSSRKYHLLTDVESIVPLVFAVVFGLLFILVIAGVPITSIKQ